VTLDRFLAGGLFPYPARGHDRNMARFTCNETHRGDVTEVTAQFSAFLALLVLPIVLIQEPPTAPAVAVLLPAVAAVTRSSYGRYRRVRLS
jgi:hypothetical protein